VADDGILGVFAAQEAEVGAAETRAGKVDKVSSGHSAFDYHIS